MTRELVRQAMAAFREQGVGRAIGLTGERSIEGLDADAGRFLEAIHASPLPLLEWPAMKRVLGEDLLIELVGVSSSSVQRYSGGGRETPDEVAERLHALTLMVNSLRGSYNDIGVRRWFARPRAALDHQAPLHVLQGGAWSPDDDAVQRVRALADSLLGPGSLS